MSELYQDPKKLKRELSNNKTGNWFQDTFTNWVTPGLSIGDDGQVNREGAAWWLQGLTPGAEGIARKKDEIEEATAVRNAVVRSGLDDNTILETLGDRKLNSDNVTGVLKTAERNYQTPAQKAEAEERKRSAEQSRRESQASITNASRQLDITEQTNRDNAEWRKFQAIENRKDRALERQDRALERNDRAKDRAQERLLSAETNQMNLQFKYAQLAQSERVRAQERKDAAIMSLINGLGNLGAAFAI